MMDGKLSVILPCYNEQDNVPLAAERIGKILSDANIPYELLFVDDGSKDDTWKNISALSQGNPFIRGLHFSRNFGKESAIYAGLCNAVGDCVVLIDCDLQHPPDKIVEMYRLWQQGYEVVEGIKSDRGKESFAHRLAAGCFYKIISSVSGIDMQHASDFKLLDKDAVTVLKHMPEREAFFRALSSWVGFKSTTVSYEVQERVSGESKWSTRKLFRYAVTNITSFSTAPMQIVTFLGVIMMLVGVIFGVIALVQKCMGLAVTGFTTVILLQVFIGAVIMLSLGIIGFYIAKIYTELKHRPRYIVSETCGADGGNVVKTR